MTLPSFDNPWYCRYASTVFAGLAMVMLVSMALVKMKP